MNEREKVGERILDEGGRHMDNKNYQQAIDAYKRMEHSTAPEDYKEMARKFIKQAETSRDMRKGLL